MRHLTKSWKNKRSGFTHRIRWYEDTADDIRLQVETPEGKWNLYPNNREEAQQLWDHFKATTNRFLTVGGHFEMYITKPAFFATRTFVNDLYLALGDTLLEKRPGYTYMGSLFAIVQLPKAYAVIISNAKYEFDDLGEAEDFLFDHYVLPEWWTWPVNTELPVYGAREFMVLAIDRQSIATYRTLDNRLVDVGRNPDGSVFPVLASYN